MVVKQTSDGRIWHQPELIQDKLTEIVIQQQISSSCSLLSGSPSRTNLTWLSYSPYSFNREGESLPCTGDLPSNLPSSFYPH